MSLLRLAWDMAAAFVVAAADKALGTEVPVLYKP